MSITYNTSTVRNGLVLHLDAANKKSYPGSGSTWIDLGPYVTDGTLINDPTFDVGDNGSIIFDGTSEYATLPHNAIFSFGSSGFTFDFFINVPLSTLTARRLFQKGVAGQSNLEYFFSISSTGVLTAATSTTGTTQTATITSTVSVKNNNWTHVALVKSDTSAIFYKDGLPEFTGTLDQNIRQASGLEYIGGASASNFFTGKMSSVKVYNRALTDQEVKQNFESLRGRYGV